MMCNMMYLESLFHLTMSGAASKQLLLMSLEVFMVQMKVQISQRSRAILDQIHSNLESFVRYGSYFS